ncbi:MAG: hypothetical protein V4616_09930, partial [Bacteroidota bacterium]
MLKAASTVYALVLTLLMALLCSSLILFTVYDKVISSDLLSKQTLDERVAIALFYLAETGPDSIA